MMNSVEISYERLAAVMRADLLLEQVLLIDLMVMNCDQTPRNQALAADSLIILFLPISMRCIYSTQSKRKKKEIMTPLSLVLPQKYTLKKERETNLLLLLYPD